MFVLSEQQVSFILDDIRRNGIETEELQFNLLDHICCVVENEMSPDMSFEEVYGNVLPAMVYDKLAVVSVVVP